MSKLTFKQAKYIRFLISAKDWSKTSGVLYGHPLEDVLNKRDNGMSVYLDTRSPGALSYEDAKDMIEVLVGLEYRSSKEDFQAEQAKKAEEFKAAKAAKAEVKPEPKAIEVKPAKAPAKKAAAKSKDPKKPMASEGFVNGKATVGSRKGIVLPDVPAAGRTYEVLGAAFKVAAKADALGRIRLSVV